MIELERGQHKEEIYDMWQRNFHDPLPYADFYFKEVYGKNQVLLNMDLPDNRDMSDLTRLKENALDSIRKMDVPTIKGMLHLNPYMLRMGKQSVKAHYIVGVATDEEYRRQGVMKELLVDAFGRMRKKGEMITYLMPADEHYYLPFDFRFGADQLEQEIEYRLEGQNPSMAGNVGEKDYQFFTDEAEDASAISEQENRIKDELYVIHTEISPEYLERLKKESRSDFGKLIYVYRKGEYQGRAILGAENDYMILSQISCVNQEERENFLHQLILYCEKEYHYGKYQMILDEAWEDIMRKAGKCGPARLLPVRRKKIIMFRILDLEKLGSYLKADYPVQGRVFVKDEFLKEQTGLYEFICDPKGGNVKKIIGTERDADGGSIGIGGLTRCIFEGADSLKQNPEEMETLNQKGMQLMEAFRPLRWNCIQEIV